jgi:membrane protein implicated in regulation of membrane protease activity
MTTPAMFLIATMVSGAAIAAEPMARASEVPELASMALLSVVLAGVSVAVRRTGTKADDQEDRRERGTSPRP